MFVQFTVFCLINVFSSPYLYCTLHVLDAPAGSHPSILLKATPIFDRRLLDNMLSFGWCSLTEPPSETRCFPKFETLVSEVVFHPTSKLRA